MLVGLLGFLGLGASVVCGPEQVDERNRHLESLVQRVEKISEEKSNPKLTYPFEIVAIRQKLNSKWPSPIYSRYQGGVCQIILNNNPDTHEAYEELMDRVQKDKPKMLDQAEYYVVGHEIGHCAYKYLGKHDPQRLSDIFNRDDGHESQHPDGPLQHKPPVQVGTEQKRLHEEIFADVYGIEFSKQMSGDKAAGLEDIVVKFRQKVSVDDPEYYTQHYIKSCLDGKVDLLSRLQDEDPDFAEGGALNEKAAKLPDDKPKALLK